MINRSHYRASIQRFLSTTPEEIFGCLTGTHRFRDEAEQKAAWKVQIKHLQKQLENDFNGDIFFEFTIPRIGKRVDVILLIEGVLYVIEYKVGAIKYDRHSIDQALDYALDLRNFHSTSFDKDIVPILIATKADPTEKVIQWDDNRIAKPICTNGDNLCEIVKEFSIERQRAYRSSHAQAFEFSEPDTPPIEDWESGGYHPTPTIIEAAQALYRGNAVEDISRSDAGTKNLSQTSECISRIIQKSREQGRKSICFVTGVPGSGKTLVGLNIATKNPIKSDERAVFLSGNGPLVDVLREALARDRVERFRDKAGNIRSENDSARDEDARDIQVTKKQAYTEASTFIQNIHHFRDEGFRSPNPPDEHVVVFDEAQRAWNQNQAEKFMTKKKGATTFDMSEPEFLIDVMDRRKDWATIVCLIGEGQEINTGEAGLSEWLVALVKKFQHWDVYHSGQLAQALSNSDRPLKPLLDKLNVTAEPDLHLSVSIRSFRSEQLSAFVAAVINGDSQQALNIHEALASYPIAITRDIQVARTWLRARARGTERLGLVASSGAMRLRSEGLHVRSKIVPANWFLNGKEDVRSSYYLEEVATEFDIQGLELDWVGVCWDADFRRSLSSWNAFSFKGTKWQKINKPDRRTYLTNSYRVLLTRARQGMVIFVPEGSEDDQTRSPSFYDQTFHFLKKCGIEEI